MSDLPSPIVTRKRIYFLCMGCGGPGACNSKCHCRSWPHTPESLLECCLEFHRHKTFGPELYGKERKRDQTLPFSPAAIKSNLANKKQKSQSEIAISIAKREVKQGRQSSLLSYLEDKIEASSKNPRKMPKTGKKP